MNEAVIQREGLTTNECKLFESIACAMHIEHSITNN